MISVCLIVRNEEEILADAVGSTVGLADEVIVVDTGSSDGTVALARDLGCILPSTADRMDKGGARNKAIDAASGDWVVILDADEQIADPVGLRKFLETTSAQAVYIRLAFVDGDGNFTLSYQQMRCWRRGTFRYKYRAHEVPVPTNGWGKVEYTEFVWEHRPPGGREWKLQYTLDRLLLDVEENPGVARPLYYLGRQYMYCKEYEKAIETLFRYLELREGSDQADAWRCLAICYSNLGERDKQVQSLFRACAEFPGRRVFWGELAEIFHSEGKEEVAAGLLKCALEIPKPTFAYTAHKWYGSHIHDLLARCLWKLERYEEGYKHSLRAIDLGPGNRRLVDNMRWFERKLNVTSKDGFLPTALEVTKGVKVLMLAYEDYSGKAYACMDAFNKHTDGRARLVTYKDSYLQYPTDIHCPTEDELRMLVEWADVVHVYDHMPHDIEKWGRPLVITYSGKFYRRDYEEFNKRDKALGAVQLCSTIDLAQYGARWCPRPIESINADGKPDGCFVVFHSPTRAHKKGTDDIIRELNGLDGIRLDVVQGVSNRECLEHKSKAHVYIDHMHGMGYGTNSLEAWAIGMPVISSVSDELRGRIVEEVGYLPFIAVEIDNLRKTVERLRDDEQFYWEGCELGSLYVKEFHNPRRVASMLQDAYEEAVTKRLQSTPYEMYHDVLWSTPIEEDQWESYGQLVRE